MNFTHLENYLDYLTYDFGVPGVDCLVTKDGEELYRYGKGIADKDTGAKVQPNQLFNLYSASKPITCTAALQLVERGKIALNQPLYDIIPEFRNMKVMNADGKAVPAKKPIIMRHLFSMTAGFSYNLWNDAMKEVSRRTNGAMPTVESVKAFAAEPLSFEPGTHWQYSVCHDILGAVIEIVSGMSFGDYLKQNIFEPLEMNDTGFERSDEVCSRIAPLYELHDSGAENVFEKKPILPNYVLGPEYQSGGAGLVSSVDDYMKFIIAMYSGGVGKNGARILSKRAIDLMRTNQLDEVALKDYNWDALTGYGYGLGVRTNIHPEKAGLSPAGEFGWSGAAGAYIHIDPENRIGLYYSQHMLNNMEHVIAPRLRNLLYAALEY